LRFSNERFRRSKSAGRIVYERLRRIAAQFFDAERAALPPLIVA